MLQSGETIAHGKDASRWSSSFSLSAGLPPIRRNKLKLELQPALRLANPSYGSLGLVDCGCTELVKGGCTKLVAVVCGCCCVLGNWRV